MPLNHKGMQAIRARHQQHTCASHCEPGICVHCQDKWPCDAVKLLDVAAAAAYFAETWAELITLMPDEYDCTMQCGEAEAAAGLYRALGDGKTAEEVLDAHAAHDTEEDSHYERGAAVIRAAREEQQRDRAAGRGSPVPGS